MVLSTTFFFILGLFIFHILDYNGDNKIDLEDLKEVTARLTGIKDDNEDFTDDDIELKEIVCISVGVKTFNF